jgi:hypothetical protein
MTGAGCWTLAQCSTLPAGPPHSHSCTLPVSGHTAAAAHASGGIWAARCSGIPRTATGPCLVLVVSFGLDECDVHYIHSRPSWRPLAACCSLTVMTKPQLPLPRFTCKRHGAWEHYAQLRATTLNSLPPMLNYIRKRPRLSQQIATMPGWRAVSRRPWRVSP